MLRINPFPLSFIRKRQFEGIEKNKQKKLTKQKNDNLLTKIVVSF